MCDLLVDIRHWRVKYAFWGAALIWGKQLFLSEWYWCSGNSYWRAAVYWGPTLAWGNTIVDFCFFYCISHILAIPKFYIFAIEPRCRRLCCGTCCSRRKRGYDNEPYSEPGLLWPWHNVQRLVSFLICFVWYSSIFSANIFSFVNLRVAKP